MNRHVCWIIAGPNGAGKTTFALKYLPQVAGCRSFVNADLIAAGLSPLFFEHRQIAGFGFSPSWGPARGLQAGLVRPAIEMGKLMSTPEQDDQQMLDALREAVAETLERKRRLGQYAVVWRNDKPAFIGDAPSVPVEVEMDN